MRRFLAVLVLGLATAASANNIACPQGWLVGPAGQGAAAIGPNIMVAKAAPALVVQAVTTAGTATVVLEMCCSPLDCSSAGPWAPVTGGSMSLTTTTPQVVSVTAPACMYRANVTACAGCAVNVAAACSGP